MTLRIASGLLLGAALLVLGAGCEKSPAVPPVLADPGSVLSITMESSEPGAEYKVLIDDPARIKDLLSLAVFKQKPPCRCHHAESLTFRCKEDEVTAYICEHCVDLFEGESCTNYEMTEGFYRKYRDLLADAKSARSR